MSCMVARFFGGWDFTLTTPSRVFGVFLLDSDQAQTRHTASLGPQHRQEDQKETASCPFYGQTEVAQCLAMKRCLGEEVDVPKRNK